MRNLGAKMEIPVEFNPLNAVLCDLKVTKL